MRRAPWNVAILLTMGMAGLLVNVWESKAQVKDGDKTAKLKAIPPGTGVLRGKITLKGPPPDLKALTTKLLEAIAKKDEKACCLKGNDFEKTPQEYRLGGRDGKQVGNVFVWLVPEPGYFFEISDKQLDEAKKKEVVLRQPHCAFIPHCAVLFPRYHPDPENPRKFEATGQSGSQEMMLTVHVIAAPMDRIHEG
jgi:hypothetical protein